VKLKRWREYIEDLSNDNRSDVQPITNDQINEKGPDITKEEVIHATKAQKDRKATGSDGTHAEVLKLIADEEGAGLNILTSLLNTVYKTGIIPTDWLKSTFIPKKNNASKCDNVSHVLKGFRNGVGAWEALFSLNVLTQRCRDMIVNVYACFFDYKKAFDWVNKLIEILQATGIDKEETVFISQLSGIKRQKLKLSNQRQS